MGATWLQTTRRILPRLARLSRELRPTIHLESAAEISPEAIKRLGVRTLLWDVDGTLMAHHAKEVDASVRGAVETLWSDPDLRHAIVSNCQEDRFGELAQIFPHIPVMLGYATSEGEAYRVRRGETESWRGPGAARAQDRPGELTPVRKPSRPLVLAALAELEAEDVEAAMMIGDQYFTDIASANLAGLRSIKVRPLHPRSFPTPVRISHRLERWLYRLVHGRPHYGMPDRPSSSETDQ